ncbi:hypothetical protein ABIA48_001849 [Pseudomonas sp. S30_BP2TU TE3576]|uniref:VPA1267 family protein n=1 Tax=Pseudomonas sp. S30_BP2TU TE3576 TaxID=3349329 RepID=UPI003D2498C8
MANGKQLAEQNLAIFIGWVASKNDTDFRKIIARGVLSRTEIARECGFAKSALNQNPRIKNSLHALEEQLRARAVLPPRAPLPDTEVKGGAETCRSEMSVADQNKAERAAIEGRESELLHRLQLENANQKAEITELRRRLSKYESLHQALASTGRVPR